jgi:hypothetical protein
MSATLLSCPNCLDLLSLGTQRYPSVTLPCRGIVAMIFDRVLDYLGMETIIMGVTHSSFTLVAWLKSVLRYFVIMDEQRQLTSSSFTVVIGKNPEIYELLGSSFTYTYKETVRELELSSLFSKRGNDEN